MLFLTTVRKLNPCKSHSFSLMSYQPALLPEDICTFPPLPHCRRIKLFLSAVSWLILFSQCSSFLGRGVSQIYSFHYLRLKLLMRFILAAGGWGKALLSLNSQAAGIPCRRHWTRLQPHTPTTNAHFLLSWVTNRDKNLGLFLCTPDPGWTGIPLRASRICSFAHRDRCSCSSHPFTAADEEGVAGFGAMGCPSWATLSR